jgi:hypothetical protein
MDTLTEPALKLTTLHFINLIVDPKERKAIDLPSVAASTSRKTGRRIFRQISDAAVVKFLVPRHMPLTRMVGPTPHHPLRQAPPTRANVQVFGERP